MTTEALELIVENIPKAGEALAEAVRHEMALEDGRARVKTKAILRIVGTENPLTNKPHSASSAEAIVETDAEYAAYREEQRSATVLRIRAAARYEAAKAMARLAARTEG